MPLTLKQAAVEIGFKSPRTVLGLAQKAKRIADRGGLPSFGYTESGQWFSGVYKAGRVYFVEERAVTEYKRSRMVKSRAANQRPVLPETAAQILARLRGAQQHSRA